MPYLIDGHNLIAKMPDISLDDPDDEARLIAKLRTFCARSGKKATVYFDRRAHGSPDPPLKSGLSVHFVSTPRTADEAIRAHLLRLGPEAKNWTVISSDREVQVAAGHAGAKIISSQTFAYQISGISPPSQTVEKPETPVSEEDIEQWEQLFRNRKMGE